MAYDSERFQVIRHHDSNGAWYRVIDKQNANATIKAFRSQKVAHRYCRETNAGWRRVHSRGERSGERTIRRAGESLSGSDWFHAGMPS